MRPIHRATAYVSLPNEAFEDRLGFGEMGTLMAISILQSQTPSGLVTLSQISDHCVDDINDIVAYIDVLEEYGYVEELSGAYALTERAVA